MEWVLSISTGVLAVLTGVLAALTAWYAKSTKRMLVEMQAQGKIMHQLLVVAGYSALVQGRYTGDRRDFSERLVKVVQDLDDSTSSGRG